jgi:hypothetical protein
MKLFGFTKKFMKKSGPCRMFGIILISSVCFSCGGGGGSSSGASGGGGGNDILPPSTPTSLTVSAVSSDRIDLNWTASTDNIGVAGYKIYRNDVFIRTLTDVVDDETIKYSVQVDLNPAPIPTQIKDNGEWNAGQSEAYTLSVVQTAAVTNYSDIGLAANTLYCYAVTAFDAAGNESIKSSEACATTLNIGCGIGIPLVLSNLVFPDVVDDNTSVNGSAGYSGSFEDIINPVMVAEIPTTTSVIHTANFTPITANNCIINFVIRIPQGLSGFGPINLKLTDYDNSINSRENYEVNGVSNIISKQITFR